MVLTVVGYRMGRSRALSHGSNGSVLRALHSLPSYYGAYVALWCALPAIVLLAFWLSFQGTIIDSVVLGTACRRIAAQSLPSPERLSLMPERQLLVNNLATTATCDIASEPDP